MSWEEYGRKPQTLRHFPSMFCGGVKKFTMNFDKVGRSPAGLRTKHCDVTKK